MNIWYLVLVFLYNSSRPILTVIAIFFAALQLLIARNMGAIESHGQMLDIASSAETTDVGLKWALTELAPCQGWRGLDHRPVVSVPSENADVARTKLDKKRKYEEQWLKTFGDKWDYCRHEARDLSKIEAGDFGFANTMYCPANEKDNWWALIGWPEEQLRGALVRESNFSCVAFTEAVLPHLIGDDSKFVATDFTGATLTSSKWKHSDLSHAEFNRSCLNDATFKGEKLSLVGASFTGANLREAKFLNVDFTGVRSFESADLSGATFEKPIGLDVEKLLLEACADRDAQPIGLGDVSFDSCPKDRVVCKDYNR